MVLMDTVNIKFQIHDTECVHTGNGPSRAL
eukprot:COSAG01_NODE_50_length_31487_cov_90.470243_12_plen_30_part_00